MQTFVPEPSMLDSVCVLDRQRLGKQRVETLQIMKALAGLSKGWVNHPATRMWRGYEHALLAYQAYTVAEWQRRGYKDTCWDKTVAVYNEHFREHENVTLPHWWGDDRVHDSHKSALVYKDPSWYNSIWPNSPAVYDYYWPVPKEDA